MKDNLDSIYAIIVTGPGNGVMTIGSTPDEQQPCVTQNPKMLKHYEKIARDVSKRMKKELIIVRFDAIEVLGRFKGGT